MQALCADDVRKEGCQALRQARMVPSCLTAVRASSVVHGSSCSQHACPVAYLACAAFFTTHINYKGDAPKAQKHDGDTSRGRHSVARRASQRKAESKSSVPA